MSDRTTGSVTHDTADLDEVRRVLRAHGARFAFLHGSRVSGSARADSDLDVAAWFGHDPGRWWELPLPDHVDLLMLDTAPFELAGRVALHGQLLFDDAAEERVRWQAQTRLQYLDEEPRRRMVNEVFLESHRGR